MDEELKLCFERSDEPDHYATTFFKLEVAYVESNLEDCDYLISSSFPKGLNNTSELQKILNRYRLIHKKVIAFLISDCDEDLDVPENVLLFRTSMYKSRQKANEIVLPYIWECFDEPFFALKKTEKPNVGFCGSIRSNLGKRLSCIRAFEAYSQIESNFILRNDFWGGKPHDATYKSDFFNNILQSHFTIANRGVGNFSMRFYQTLSLGRIPILLNSDMALPFENEIKWDEIVLTANTEDELVKRVLQFWQTKSETEVEAVQQNCKQVFDTYLKPPAYGRRIFDLLVQFRDAGFPCNESIPIRKKWWNKLWTV